MIRRISKNNDLKDLIKSCPSGVIDDITEIRYFISGHPETEIVATFEKVGTHLEAILPTSDLATLSNGVLMRRALYKVADSSYPDGYYNLEFIDNLDVWLGDEETQDPFDPGYLTEEDLKTLNGESLVGVGNIDVVNYIPDYYATKSWVSSNFLSSTALTGYATQSWVQSQGYLTSHQDLSSYATKSWVSSQQFITSVALTGYATQSWVKSQGYITSAGLSGLATQSWVSSNFLSSTALTGYATQSWVQSQGYLTEHQDLSSYATKSWATSEFFEESKIWTGTQSQWGQLTPEQKALYTIALVTE